HAATGGKALPTQVARRGPEPTPTAVELRSADFSPLPSGSRKSGGSGMNSVLQVPRNSLNSTAAGQTPGPSREGKGRGGDKREPPSWEGSELCEVISGVAVPRPLKIPPNGRCEVCGATCAG